MPHIILLIGFLLPSILFAAQTPTDFKSLVAIFLDIINILIPFIFTLTLLVLFWGITKSWIIHGGDPGEIEKGKKLVVVGIVAFVVMSGIWGLVAIVRNTFFGA